MCPDCENPTFMFWFALFFNIPCFLMNLTMIRFGRYIPVLTRVMVSQVLFLAILIAVPFVGSARRDGKLAQKATNNAIYGLVALCGLITGVSFPSTSGLASTFPPRFMTATMSGVGLGGVIVGAIRIITRASISTDDAGIMRGSKLYFVICAVTMAAALASSVVLARLPFAKYHMYAASKAGESSARLLNEGDLDRSVRPKISYTSVFMRTWMVHVCLMVSFLITIGLFPGVASLIKSTAAIKHGSDSGWFNIILVSLFLLFDFIGRSLPSAVILFNHKNIWIPTALRLGFFPLFILCVSPRLLHGDAWPLVTMAFFALSNGYLCTRLAMLSPGLVLDHERETVGIMTVFSINTGIISGSALGILFSHILN